MKEARVVIVPLPAATLNTVPEPAGPPEMVVPKRLPLLLATTPLGLAPLATLKEARVVIVPLPTATLKTVPTPLRPPLEVVPKRLPLLSAIRPLLGLAPFARLKEARVV